MEFFENSTDGQPAIALITKTTRRIRNPANPGIGGELNKINVPAGYIRHIALTSKAMPHGDKERRRAVLGPIGGRPSKHWRIAVGTIKGPYDSIKQPADVLAFISTGDQHE